MPANPNLLDRFFLFASPRYGLERIRYKEAAELFANSGKRNYDAAKRGRRTAAWVRTTGDSNAVNRNALSALREHARDLVRNNLWAKRALRLIANGIVGHGITAKSVDKGVRANKRALAAWNAWASTTECDVNGLLNLYGLQRLAARTIAESGECLVRKVPRRMTDKLAIPLQIQVMEPDYLDATKDGLTTDGGGRIIQGVEFDSAHRRVAYWLYPTHPGDFWKATIQSVRIPADEIIHCFDPLRAGQARGVSWFAPAILKLKDLDDYDDATLMKQKIAALFTAFDVDMEGGAGSTIGEQKDPSNPRAETMEPGSIIKLSPGRDIRFANPPKVGDYKDFNASQLRQIAAGMGLPYEALTGDYSQVNFSSARMSRLVFQDDVDAWRWDFFIPQFCDGVWRWAQEAATAAGIVPKVTQAEWTPPPMRMIEPDKEGLAVSRMVRNVLKTPSAAVREQGMDWKDFLQEYKSDLADMDAAGIVSDADARKTTQAGNPIPPEDPGLDEEAADGDDAKPEPSPSSDEDDDEEEDDEDARSKASALVFN